MSKHKKQHYIPKCYLKAWCDTECPPKHTPYIWIYEKESRKGKKKSPDNIFHETDLYTIQGESGERILDIEHGLSGLENQFVTIRNKKINRHKSLDKNELVMLTTFIAASHARTKSQLLHMSDQWRLPLERMNDMAESMKTATTEEKRSMASYSSMSSSNDNRSISHEQVRQMVEDPVGTTMIPMINAEAPLIAKLDMVILCTDTSPGFITSDSPCVWYDPLSYTRPPMYRAPALMYETIEITMPVSPTKCILLNRQGLTGYINVDIDVVNHLNRRLRFHASEHYIVSKEHVNDIWFDEGEEPNDSWEKRQT